MKATFTVTVEGNWTHNGKPVTAAIVEREVREALKNEFEYRSSSVTVKRVKTERVPTQQAAPVAKGEHAVPVDVSKPCRNVLLRVGYGAVPKSCPRCGLAKECPEGHAPRGTQQAQPGAKGGDAVGGENG